LPRESAFAVQLGFCEPELLSGVRDNLGVISAGGFTKSQVSSVFMSRMIEVVGPKSFEASDLPFLAFEFRGIVRGKGRPYFVSAVMLAHPPKMGFPSRGHFGFQRGFRAGELFKM
jgi:hypothetical protein